MFNECPDSRGEACFAYLNGHCKCLQPSDMRPCPFFKTEEQVLTEDPLYRKRKYTGNNYTSFRKVAK